MSDYIGITLVTLICVAAVVAGNIRSGCDVAVAACACIIGLGLVFLGVSHSHDKHRGEHEPMLARVR
jgi:hypothetical protein